MRTYAWVLLLGVLFATGGPIHAAPVSSAGSGSAKGALPQIVDSDGAKAQAGKSVAVQGLARDAKISAAVVADNLVVYCLGVHKWPSTMPGKPVIAFGRLEQTGEFTATRGPSGEVSAGTDGPVWVLRGCRYDVRYESKTMNKTIPELFDWQHGFPIAKGARRNDALGGATSVAPGRNYTLIVYDIDSSQEAMTAFYGHHLPEAKRATEGKEVRFSTPGGTVRLARSGKGTRITLVIGPR